MTESIWSQLIGILKDSVGFIYRVLPGLMEAEERYSFDDSYCFHEWISKMLIGIVFFLLLPISLFAPAALTAFVGGVDAHLAHIETSAQYNLTDIEYAQALLPAIIVKESYIKPKYDWRTQTYTWEKTTLKTPTRIYHRRYSNEFYKMRERLADLDIERSQEIYLQMEGKLNFPSLQFEPPLLASNKVLFTYILAEYLLDMNSESMTEIRAGPEAGEKGEWRKESGLGYIIWTILIIPIGFFCWLRFWILSILLLLFIPLPKKRRVALIEYSHQTRFTWYQYFVVCMLFPILFGLFYLILSGFSLPQDSLSIIHVFASQNSSYEIVWLLSMIIGLMISTSFYRALHLFSRGVLIAILGYNHRRLGFVVCNLISITVLLSLRVSLSMIVFALLTSIYLEIHPKIVHWFEER